MAYNKETDVEAGDGNDPGSPLESPGPLSEKTSNLPPKPANLARLRLHLEGEVDTRWADIVMITCCFISGLMDSVSFNTWGCFVSMQTGRLIRNTTTNDRSNSAHSLRFNRQHNLRRPSSLP